MDKSVESPFTIGDYSLVGKNTQVAKQKGLENARWYQSPLSKEQMRALLERKDGPAIRDTLIWFGLIFLSAAGGYLLWGSAWAILPFAIYGVLYASTSDSRWHESGHGTAFKTDWMNNALYEIASFMVLRESTPWRWSHARHHSDTIIVGLDPEIAVQRPTDLLKVLSAYFNVFAAKAFWEGMARHLRGKLSPAERTYIPDSALPGIQLRAWIYLLIYVFVIALAIATRSLLPLMYIGLPTFYGAWLMVVYGYTQHAGLAENVLDHRLNCRTVYMNRLNRYLYWNMNYHVEHHMFPLVPYHALPRLHELVKADMPPAYPSIAAAYREIIPAILRQAREPGYYVRRPLPAPAAQAVEAQGKRIYTAEDRAARNGWIDVCAAGELGSADVIRFDHEHASYAIYRTADGKLYATDGICTHGNAHLAEGMVQGALIECAKHNGRFDLRDGSAVRLPACVALKTYAVREEGGRLLLDLASAGGLGVSAPPKTLAFRVVSNANVGTLMKELILEPDPASAPLEFQPGDYLQFDIPAYAERNLRGVETGERYAAAWKRMGIDSLRAENPIACRRNYSLASNPAVERLLRFNVRLALPPRGLDCPAGVGSAYLFGLRPGDRVTAIGPFGDFHIRPGGREMIYLGGGAGMAPLRSHLSRLLETEQSERQISFWYGARSQDELFYQEYFTNLEGQHPNFRFRTALSEPAAGEAWDGPLGFIHEVLRREYLTQHPDPKAVDYYLCGPPAMMQAALRMLQELGVPAEQIAYDEF